MRKEEFPIVDKVISDRINEVLNKIQVEVEKINPWALRYAPTYDKNIRPQIVSNVKEHVLEIIDKYKEDT